MSFAFEMTGKFARKDLFCMQTGHVMCAPNDTPIYHPLCGIKLYICIPTSREISRQGNWIEECDKASQHSDTHKYVLLRACVHGVACERSLYSQRTDSNTSYVATSKRASGRFVGVME